MERSEADTFTRRLRSLVESIFGVVFQTPEARAGSAGLDAVAWNIAGRAAAMGEVGPSVAAAAFAPFNPNVVRDAVRDVWQKISPSTLIEARIESALRLLEHIADDDRSRVERAIALLQPVATDNSAAGYVLYAGVRSLPWPESPVGKLWRCCELVREYRGDAHTIAWRAAGLDAVEINVLSELWSECPVGSVATYQMGWSPPAVQSALARLVDAGLAYPDGRATQEGIAVRETVEVSTSRQQSDFAEKLLPSAGELFDLLIPWAKRCEETSDEYWAADRESSGPTNC